MRALQQLRVSSRLYLGFGTMMVMLAAVVILTALNFSDVVSLLDRLFDRDWAAVDAVSSLESATRANSTRTMELLVAHSPERRRFLRERIAANKEAVAAALRQLDGLLPTPVERSQLVDIVRLREQYVESFSAVDEELLKGEVVRATERAVNETVPRLELLLARVHQLQAALKEQAGAASKGAQSRANVALYLVVGLGIAAAVVGFVFATAIGRSIALPIASAAQVCEKVASGDLTHSIEVDGKDEVAQLLYSLRSMTTRLVDVVGVVRQNAESVATASTQIAQGNQDLSQRTEKQAAALQQTAASMEQLDATVNDAAGNAQRASSLAQRASGVARDSGKAVERAVAAMATIRERSTRIGDIIATIETIAFQTNILALNAAVEAARAGEHGRGFAVVAAEVQTLAQRSSVAAKEIKTLIMDSAEKVQAGSALANEAGATMTDVVKCIEELRDIVNGISTSSTEQSTGVHQVGQAVSEMDRTTQQNAALVEESAAAAESLRVQAQQLLAAVSTFKLGLNPQMG